MSHLLHPLLAPVSSPFPLFITLFTIPFSAFLSPPFLSLHSMAPPYQDHDDPHYSDHLFFPITPPPSSSPSSSSSSSSPEFPHHTAQDHGHGGFFTTGSQQLQLKPEGGVILPCTIGLCNTDQTVGNDHPESGLRFTIWKQVDKTESSSCKDSDLVKWSSSKVRFVSNSDEIDGATVDGGKIFQDGNQTLLCKRSFNSSNDGGGGGGAVIRTCSDCSTTKTPLWRSGPRGPKSLCNACGIRQRKARRALAAAAEAAASGEKPTVPKANKAQHKAMKRAAASGNMPAALKRKCRNMASAAESRERKKHGLSESSSAAAYQRVFPQDEREAAILLMTLSYGLLHG